ncbi:methyltransferase, FxLD system [Nocardiopsis exhalans]|uniref:Protein-L-isoaspartate O-methyltransferase n=1 Tax=Nocardiopsis exhalans TaxID=163604 RepID=A0ABY5D1W6_9ACTN|nr:methyltransferase, FxLD system [Nocardiopsis exhalans]USY17985.1 methyltransferase, FxLD system [Nocardiopsis exhalans]
MTTADTTPTPAHDADQIHELRERMITRMWAINALRTDQVAQAVRAVPRHEFASEFAADEVYDMNAVLRTRFGPDGETTSSVSGTWVQALMLEHADIGPGMRVLEVGSGGYNAALIAELVGPDGAVTSIDIDPAVIDRARDCLAAAGYTDRVRLAVADAEHGFPDGAPFDRIIVTAGADDLPPAWTDQLVQGGRLVVPFSVRGFERIYVFTRSSERLLVGEGGDVAGFVRMQGQGEHVQRQVPVAEGVTFTTDADPLPDQDKLAQVFIQPAHEEWTGVRMGPREFFATLQMWLATDMPGFGTLTGDADALGHAPMPGQRTPALWNGTSLAYLVLPRVSTDPDQWEYLVRGHGPNATTLVDSLVERVRRWDTDHRGGPGPRLLASPDLPPGDEVIPTRHTYLVARWDQPLDTPRLDWEADPET